MPTIVYDRAAVVAWARPDHHPWAIGFVREISIQGSTDNLVLYYHSLENIYGP